MLSIILILFVSLMIPGVIARTRAVMSGRKGVSIYQHISSFGVLLRKGTVYSPVTGFIFKLAPVVYMGSVLAAMLTIPVGGLQPLFSFDGDVVLFCYLLALSRIMLILAAMDTGSSFEGMGASREALYSALLEPALFVVFGTLAFASGYTSFTEIFLNIGSGAEMIVAMALLMYCLFRIILIEAGRIPVDDSKTHLELTMIHEAMVLDYSGFDLALITLGGWIKTAILAVLSASAFAAAVSYDAIVVVLICILIAVAIGVTESLVARNRLARNTVYIMGTLAVAILVLMVIFIVSQNINIG